MKVESVAKDVPPKSLEENHLACSKHAAPATITFEVGSYQALLNVVTVGEPCYAFEAK